MFHEEELRKMNLKLLDLRNNKMQEAEDGVTEVNVDDETMTEISRVNARKILVMAVNF